MSVRWPLVGLITLVLVFTGLVYFPGLSGEFVLDDAANLGRTDIPNPDFWGVLYTITHNGSGWLGRSVSMASFVITNAFYGLNPWGYKFHNVLLHLFNGLLVFKFLQLSLPLLDRHLSEARALRVAGFTTLLWLLHPLLVSTVLYAVQRMTQLAVCFSLLALICYLVLRRIEKPGPSFYLLAWVAFPLCQLLAVLSKEIGALVPLYIVVLEGIAFRVSRAELRSKKHITWFLAAFVAVPLALGGVYGLLKFDDLANYSARTFTLGERLLTQIHAIFYYIQMALAPRVRDMGLYHDDFPVTHTMDLVTALLLLVLVALVAGILLLRKRAPVLAFGLALFFVSHLLESTILPLELVFEHRNYLAILGLLLPIVHAVSSWQVLRPFQILLAGFVLIFTIQTWSRVQEWGDYGMMSMLAVQDHPDSERARSYLANYYYRTGQPKAALEQLAIGQSLEPDDAGSTLNGLVILCEAKYWEPNLASKAENILGQYPVTFYALNAFDVLNKLLYRNQCTDEAPVAIQRMIDKALALPANKANPLMLGYLQRIRGLIAYYRQDYDESTDYLRAAYENTRLVTILVELFGLQLSQTNIAGAEETLELVESINKQKFGAEQFAVNAMRTKFDSIVAAKAASESNTTTAPATVSAD